MSVLKSTVLIAVMFSGCSLMYIDAPPVDLGDRWLKSGFSRSMAWRELVDCGYDDKKSNEERGVVDWCMLRKGFKYIDSPPGHGSGSGVCDALMFQNRPSCRSMRGEILISPHEMIPTVSQPAPRSENSSIDRVQIAPSTTQAQRLQEQVLRDSNTQMNQLQNLPPLTTTPIPAAASPVTPNPRLDQLKQFKSER